MNKLQSENERILKEFEAALVDVSEHRRKSLLSHIKQVAIYVGKPLSEATRTDILGAINDYKDRTKSKKSLKQRMVAIKKFYKTLYGNGEEYPEIVRGIKLPVIKEYASIKKYPSTEELFKLINTAATIRDKALVSSLYESGARINEFLNIKLEDINLESNIAYVKLMQSKTKQRTVIVKKFINEFRAWLSAHPKLNDKEAWLWVNVKDGYYGEQMQANNVREILKVLCKKAKIKVYSPHALRHKRVYDLKNIIS